MKAQCAAMRGARCSATCARKASRSCASERASTAPAASRNSTLAMQCSAWPMRVPAGRVGAAEAVQQVLRLRQRQVAGADLHVQQHQVDVQEEVQVDMHDVQQQRRIAGLRHHAHLGHVAAAEQPHRRAGRAGVALRAAVAVEEALHIGQEGDELVVVAFVEVVGVAGVFVHLLRQRQLRRQQLPGPARSCPRAAASAAAATAAPGAGASPAAAAQRGPAVAAGGLMPRSLGAGQERDSRSVSRRRSATARAGTAAGTRTSRWPCRCCRCPSSRRRAGSRARRRWWRPAAG